MAEESGAVVSMIECGLRSSRSVREISCCFFVFGLFFCEKSGESDDVCLDFGILCSYFVGGHVEGWFDMEAEVGIDGYVKRKKEE